MSMAAALSRLQVKIEEKDAAKGLVYAWWIPLLCVGGQLLSLIVAFIQRDRLTAVEIATVLVLVLVPASFMWLSDRWVPWWADLIPTFAAVALILSSPADVGAADAVSWILMFTVSKYAATEGFRIGVVSSAAAAAVLAIASRTGAIEGVWLHLTITGLGLVAGAMLHTQSRALARERNALAVEHERATLAERDRIAREIHDLVAHSLSVTMLHVTGARRMLADGAGSDGDDVQEAIDALRDAERVGRQAMADIRQTVSTLATEEADPNQALPSADDLPGLVRRVNGAGLEASFEAHGDVSRIPPALGLGLYRVVQESLTNVTKHAPGSPALVSLAVGRTDVRLTVRSTRTVPHRPHDKTGSGLTGMTARVEQLGGSLRAGPTGDAWVVEATLPLVAEADAQHDCAVSRLGAQWASPSPEASASRTS
jgi:signal transduction histidine kinase